MKKITETYGNKEWILTAGLFTITATFLGLYSVLGWELLIVLTIIFFLLPIFYRFYYEKKNEKVFFGDQAFMIEFFEAVDIINKNKKFNSKDTKHEISTLSKIFEINGADCKTTINYTGKNTSNELSHGIQIQTQGGSSVSIKSLGISCFDKSNKLIQIYPQTIYDDERKKVLFIPFSTPKSKGEKFCLEYIEEHWYGAMRSDYDGIFFYEHLYFTKGIEAVDITIKFLHGEIEELTSFIYNSSKKSLSKDRKNEVIEINQLQYQWKISDFDENNIYFIMYKYK